MGAPQWETGTTVYWGSLCVRPLAGLALLSFPASSFPGCQSAALEKQFLSVSLDHSLLSLPGCTVCILLFRLKLKGLFSHHSYWEVKWMIALKLVLQNKCHEELQVLLAEHCRFILNKTI